MVIGMVINYSSPLHQGKGYTRGVTKSHFERIMHFLDLKVCPEDLQLIASKFEDPSSGDVCYSAFIQAIDDLYVGQGVEQPQDTG